MARASPDFDYDKYMREIACMKAQAERQTTKGAKETNP